MAIPYRQQDDIKRRIERFFLFIAACYVALIVRLVYLQAIEGGYYRNRATKLRTETVPLPAQRGTILDRNGKPLAEMMHQGDMVCDPRLVKNPRRTAALLASLLDCPPEPILPLLSPRMLPNGHAAGNVVIRKGIDPAILDRIQSAKADRHHGSADLLAGINIIDHLIRTYPDGREAVHVVGLLASDRHDTPHGNMGVEQYCDTQLCGHNGYIVGEVDAQRRPIPDTQHDRVDPQDGADVRLTIDSAIQHIAEQELLKCYQEHHPDGAAAIVLDPKTGDVLAMVSLPDFDPSNRREMNAPGQPALNRALTPFEPGSTMKVLAVAAALNSGAITRTSKFYCDGSLQVVNRTIRDAEHVAGGHGECDIARVIAESCNICMAQIGMKSGMDAVKTYLQHSGVLDKTGVELTADQHGSLGEIPANPTGGKIKVARVAFGQSVLVSPLAMASMYAAIANGGVRMPPRLVLTSLSPNGRVNLSSTPRPGTRVMSADLASYLSGLLEGVVTSGTGKGKANVPGYTVAGKTGTAQKVQYKHKGYSGQHIASFIGFLPARNPRAVIYVMADNPKGGLYYGAEVAAPVFKAIAQRLMWYWKVTPDDPASIAPSPARIAAANR